MLTYCDIYYVLKFNYKKIYINELTLISIIIITESKESPCGKNNMFPNFQSLDLGHWITKIKIREQPTIDACFKSIQLTWINIVIQTAQLYYQISIFFIRVSIRRKNFLKTSQLPSKTSDTIRSPLPLTQDVTVTYSLTNDGTWHLSTAVLPDMTNSS